MDQRSKCKITVISKNVNNDLIHAYMNEEGKKNMGICQVFEKGDEFFVNSEFQMPENFCHWAWADIRKDILAVVHNARFPWFKEKGIMISGCTDWFRPVLFKIEKI